VLVRLVSGDTMPLGPHRQQEVTRTMLIAQWFYDLLFVRGLFRLFRRR
jgi:hypothetical protein